ncbi:putative quinol monooxygenase [Mucilaginibacter kameinonensis]|uniref:putative quinol monooxygenase n=1 Tax=Mucilaginibacter kameinonensis TaxID=452286 RepID=UPI000EF78319|nr:antibiotic biosynthesis monooxygenase [Mucilaginibacter kameinonensis]
MKQINIKALLPITLVFLIMVFTNQNASAQQGDKVVHIAKLQIDPAQLDNYKVFLKEQIETAVRVEPGVLTLHAVADKNNPAHITVFEIYADTVAYKAHLQTSHFKKYKIGTKDMVKSLELIDVVPLELQAKGKL